MDEQTAALQTDDRPPVEDMRVANMDGIDYMTLLLESRVLQFS